LTLLILQALFIRAQVDDIVEGDSEDEKKPTNGDDVLNDTLIQAPKKKGKSNAQAKGGAEGKKTKK